MPDADTRGLYLAILLLAVFTAGAGGAALVLWLQPRPSPRTLAVAPEAAPLEPVQAKLPAPAMEEPIARATESPSRAPAAPPAAVPAAAATPAMLGAEDVIASSLPAVALVEGKGSAFFVAPDRLITNHHVVGGDSSVMIKTHDGARSIAMVIRRAADYDLAVLQVPAPRNGQAVLELGSALGVRAGQPVIAIGSPLGLTNSVSRGVVSATRRRGPALVIQTDVAVNPGNSGGPLLDESGRVVGITTFGSLHLEGLNFAVAIDHAAAILEDRSPMLASALRAQDPVLGGTTKLASVAEADRARAQAQRLLGQRLEGAARECRSLDLAVRRFLAGHFRGRLRGEYEYVFYALFEPNLHHVFEGTFSRGYEEQFELYRKHARGLRDAIDVAEEDARRADVAPGVRRALREQHGFDRGFWVQ